MRKLVFLLLLFPSLVLAQTTNRVATNISFLHTNVLTVTGSIGDQFTPGFIQSPAENRVCWRLQSAGDWLTCTPWIGDRTVNGTTFFGGGDMAPVTVSGAGNWCFRAQTRLAATQVLTPGGLSVGDPGPDGGCCVVLPSTENIQCDTSGNAGRTSIVHLTQQRATEVASWVFQWGASAGSHPNTSTTSVNFPSDNVSADVSFNTAAIGTSDLFVIAHAVDHAGASTANSAEVSYPYNNVAPLGQSGISTVYLWNAASSGIDTVIDSSFSPGDTISNTYRTCVEIEAKPNAWLANSGPGSILFTLDGATGEPGKHCENNPPYAEGGDITTDQFNCNALLAVVGAHTLVLRPYDSEGCTGLAGPVMTIPFTTAGP